MVDLSWQRSLEPEDRSTGTIKGTPSLRARAASHASTHTHTGAPRVNAETKRKM
jgi:hypothetical protein